MPLGALQKGSFDIVGVTVEIRPNTSHPTVAATAVSEQPHPDNKLEWLIHLSHPVTMHEFEVAAESKEEAVQWADTIKETGKSASYREVENRKRERAMRIARELSNLVIYCRYAAAAAGV